MKMEKIYPDSEEKLVKTTVVYADADDGYLHYDSAKSGECKVPVADLKNLFLKGMTIVHNGNMFKPVFYKEAANDSYVSVYEADGTEYSFYGAEHSAD